MQNQHLSIWRDGLLLAILLLLGLGTVMVFSSTGLSRSLELQLDSLIKHTFFLALATSILLTVWKMPQQLIFKLSPWVFLAGTLLLILVLVPGLGSQINGARRWFRFGPASLQPSEFMKILLPLFLAWWSQGTTQRKGTLVHLVGLAALISAPLLIALQPDLGTALIVFGIGTCYLFLSGWPLAVFISGLISVIPALILLMLYRPYQLERISSYLQAIGHWEQAQYQVKQSLLSIGAGGFWGMGPGAGLQKLSFLPESHNDFIFAVVGEELGLVGMLAVVGLWVLLLACGTRLTYSLRHDRERFSLAGTLLTGIVFQALVNICVVTSLLPPKGISHPLLSYGGSNLLAMMLALGLILNLTSQPDPDSKARNL